MTKHAPTITLTKRKLKSIVKNEEKTAIAANLEYVTDKEPGISRKKTGKSFHYFYENKPLKDDEDLVRIKSLAIPPAWTSVWICKKANGHLQATGYDARGRKQYRYHPDWNRLRTHTKFYRMIAFGRTLSDIRKALRKDLKNPELDNRKVLAAIVSLIEKTNIRIGNSEYERENGSFGITTLKDRHVNFNGDDLEFIFKGKKGIRHTIPLKNKKLARIVKECRDIPGRELFQYYDAAGNHYSIDSGAVNQYIKEISGHDFTAKDFRTWSGTVHAFEELSKAGPCESAADVKRKINDAVDAVSKRLGNTRTVCKKYYVHPLIPALYEENKLEKYFEQMKNSKEKSNVDELSSCEKIVLQILESNNLSL